MLYAVRAGHTPGIYASWEECKTQVAGFPCAEFRKFAREEDAAAYVKGITGLADGIYTDGSHKRWAFVVVEAGDIVARGYGAGPADGSNIDNELLAALSATKWAADHGYTSITIYHDYTGVAMFAIGAWKARKPTPVRYAREMGILMQKVTVAFHHIPGHAGVEGNHIVDRMCK